MSPPVSVKEKKGEDTKGQASTSTSKSTTTERANDRNSRVTSNTTTDPVLRNALRYTMSAREYAALHHYVLSKSRLVKRSVPSPTAMERILEADGKSAIGASTKAKAKGGSPHYDGNQLTHDTFNVRAVRHSLRVLVVTGSAMKLWDVIKDKVATRSRKGLKQKQKPSNYALHKSPVLRLSLSLSLILLLYRLLFRFFVRLRGVMLEETSQPFWQRNPRVARALASPYTPAIGASVAGLALGIYPVKQLRMTIALIVMFRALEFSWNSLELNGHVWGWHELKGKKIKRERPWWFGSWMLQPLAFGQLIYANVFDRDCFPRAYGDFIYNFSETYIRPPPALLSAHQQQTMNAVKAASDTLSVQQSAQGLRWPGPSEIVDMLADMGRANWPAATLPSIFPAGEGPSAAALAAGISPLTLLPVVTAAHPSIKHLSCAILHPSDPSCLRSQMTYWLHSLPKAVRYMVMVHMLLLIPSFRSLYNRPVSTLRQLLIERTLRLAIFVSGSIGTAWGSICLFQHIFPRNFLPTQRFFLSGFLAGFWGPLAFETNKAYVRSVFLYSARASVESLWKVLGKRGLLGRGWSLNSDGSLLRALAAGEVWLFVMSLALAGAVYETDKNAVRETYLRKGLSWAKGAGWKDWAAVEDEGEEGGGEGVVQRGSGREIRRVMDQESLVVSRGC